MAEILTEDGVTATLRLWGRTGLEWGVSDCAMSVFTYLADHCERPQSLRHWRGQYTCEATAKRRLRALGGPVRAFQDEARRSSLSRTHSPQRGDVGLVRDGARQLVAGICLGDGKWAVRAHAGFLVHAFDPIVAYSVRS